MSAERQAIGRSRGGLTTKLMAMVDKTGRLVRFTLRPGNAAEAPELPTPLDGVLTNELIADKAYDSDPIRISLAAQGIVATIPPRVAGRLFMTSGEESGLSLLWGDLMQAPGPRHCVVAAAGGVHGLRPGRSSGASSESSRAPCK